MGIITAYNKGKRDVANRRILEVMNFVVANNLNSIPDETNFLKSIGYSSPKNVTGIKSGILSFQMTHVENTCSVYGVSADFLLNEKIHKMFLNQDKETPMFRLKVATKEVEIYLKDLERGK